MDNGIDDRNIFTLESGEVVIVLNVASYKESPNDDNKGSGYDNFGVSIYELIHDASKIKISDSDTHSIWIEYGGGSCGLFPKDTKIYKLENKCMLIINIQAKIVKLDSFQVEAVKKIEKCFLESTNPICAYPVGTGKTYIACELMRRFRGNGNKKILLLAKASNLEDPWGKTLESFLIPFCIIHGPKRKNEYLFDNKYQTGHNVVLTSYDTWLRDNDCYDAENGYDLVVFDELHTIINPKKITQKSLVFSKVKSRHRLATTATPIQNTDADIGFMYIFLNNPTLLDSIEEGENVVTHERFSIANDEAMRRNAVILPDRVVKREVVVKKAILSLPLSCEMNKYIMENDVLFRNEHKLFSFLSCPESLCYNNSSEKLNLPCTKADAVNMIIDAMSKDDKIIIFSRHIDVLSAYYERLKKKGCNALILTGEDRGDAIKRKLSQFRNNRIFRVLLTTLFKSAEGLNLEIANHVIVLEFWWNPQKIMQAMGRIDRRTQKRDCFIYLLCYNKNGSMYGPEKKYFEVMEKKIAYAKPFVSVQEELPMVEVFVGKNTFSNDFSDFLVKFKTDQKAEGDNPETPNKNNQLMEFHDNKEDIYPTQTKSFQDQMNEIFLEKMMHNIFTQPNFDEVEFKLE